MVALQASVHPKKISYRDDDWVKKFITAYDTHLWFGARENRRKVGVGPKADRQLLGGLTSQAAIMVTTHFEPLHGDGMQMSVAEAIAPPVWLVLSEKIFLPPACYG